MTCKLYTRKNLLCLSFFDDSAKWPSKSNDAAIYYRNGKPSVRHTKEFHQRMASIKVQYKLACQHANLYPAFGKSEIICFCLLGKKTRLLDSHNFCKTFCDFAEDVGITDNDRHITCWPVHKKTCGIMGFDESSTDVLIRKTSDFNFDDFMKDFSHE